MRIPFPIFLLLLVLSSCSSTKKVSAPPGLKLLWSDEFNDPGMPDPSRWDYDIGGHGWGNRELQYYTNESANVRVEQGVLVIEALKAARDTNQYTSARLVSKGRRAWLYGRMEVRARLPKGLGTWPAIWMLPEHNKYGGWPKSGEIDVMEHVGFDPGRVHASVHTEAYNHIIGTQKTAQVQLPDFHDQWHVYWVDWKADEIVVGVDDQSYFSFKKDPNAAPAAWPFDQPFHVLLNIAVGGNWGGMKGVDASVFPQRMYIDYVRVYQNQ